MEWNQIRREDCVRGMASLPEGCASLVFADPPFNIGYDYDVYNDEQDHSQYLRWSEDWIAAVHRILKPDGTFWLAIGDEYAAELKLISQRCGFQCRSWVVWYYTFGVNCRYKFTRSHAHLFYLVKDPERYTFLGDLPENRIPSARQLVYADARANPRGRLPDDTWVLRPQDLQGCFTTDEDTWYFPRVAGTFKERAGFHGCQMPEQLLGRIIRVSTREGELVVDPFSGSATTLAVAKKLGRTFLGFEISPEYVERGEARLGGVRRGDPLDGSAEPLMSAPTTANGKVRGVNAGQGRKRSKSQKSVDEGPASPVPSLSDSDLAERLRSTTEEALKQAFVQIHDGYSLDRVVADPDLNCKLESACKALGLMGDLRSWNHAMFRLRKSGRLADIDTHRRTEFSWEACDRYLFASEIAMRQLLDRGIEGIDEILCDPPLANEFDAIARSLAPGFSSLEYRWAALKLRKEAKTARVRAKVLAPIHLHDASAVAVEQWPTVPEQPGVYLVTGDPQRSSLYAGGSLNLRERMRQQFGSDALMARWRQWSDQLRVCFCPLDSDSRLLLAYQSRIVGMHDPQLNFPELAAV